MRKRVKKRKKEKRGREGGEKKNKMIAVVRATEFGVIITQP